MEFSVYQSAYTEFPIFQHIYNQHLISFLQHQKMKQMRTIDNSNVVCLCLQSNMYVHNWQKFNPRFTLYCLQQLRQFIPFSKSQIRNGPNGVSPSTRMYLYYSLAGLGKRDD